MKSTTKAVLFDLGNTLAAYYHGHEFQAILAHAIENVHGELQQHGLSHLDVDTAKSNAVQDNREASDFRVRPLAERLSRVFELESPLDAALLDKLSHCFLEPIFAAGRCYEDARPALQQLRDKGYRIALVSNSPWGTPAAHWRREIVRLELAEFLDTAVFCGDIGFRKPARLIFEHTARQLDVSPSECAFIGDIPEWDIVGSRDAGMRPILIDRYHEHEGFDGERIVDLVEIVNCVGQSIDLK